MDFFFILITVVMVYIMLEDNKIKNIFEKIYRVDTEIENELMNYINGKENLDIYTIQEIRTMLTNKFVKSHKLDEFKIYKESMYKVSVILRLGLAVQKLEIITNSARLKLEEVSLEYSNINFSKK